MMLCSLAKGSACRLSPRERGRHRWGLVPKPSSPAGSPAASPPSHQHHPHVGTGAEQAGVPAPQNQSASHSTGFPAPPPRIPGPGKESAAPGTGPAPGTGWCCLCAGRAPGASDSQGSPAPLHASPSAKLPGSPFPSLAGWQPGHQAFLPQPSLGVPHLLAGLAPNHFNSLPRLIEACKADPHRSPLPLPALCNPSPSPNPTHRLVTHPAWHSPCCPGSPRTSPQVLPGLVPAGHCPGLQARQGASALSPAEEQGSSIPGTGVPQVESGYAGRTGAEPPPALRLPGGRPHCCLSGKGGKSVFFSPRGGFSSA